MNWNWKRPQADANSYKNFKFKALISSMFYELRSTQVMSFVGIFNILWEVLALFKYPNNE